MAGMWAYRARDAVATAMHGMWGSFWIAYGILNVSRSCRRWVSARHCSQADWSTARAVSSPSRARMGGARREDGSV